MASVGHSRECGGIGFAHESTILSDGLGEAKVLSHMFQSCLFICQLHEIWIKSRELITLMKTLQ